MERQAELDRSIVQSVIGVAPGFADDLREEAKNKSRACYCFFQYCFLYVPDLIRRPTQWASLEELLDRLMIFLAVTGDGAPLKVFSL